MDVRVAGAQNLAAAVARIAGRRGSVAHLRGCTAIAGVIELPNGYVNAVVPTDHDVSADAVLDDATNFFADHDRAFVLWVPESRRGLADAAVDRGGTPNEHLAPAMVARSPLRCDHGFEVALVSDDGEASTFGDLAERGYSLPGMAYLLEAQDSYRAPDTMWAIASRDGIPMGVAAGVLDGETGGIYYVATPAEFRGRGIGAATTAWVANELFVRGARTVTLQASEAGFAVYRRIGFETYDRYLRFTFSKIRSRRRIDTC